MLKKLPPSGKKGGKLAFSNYKRQMDVASNCFDRSTSHPPFCAIR